MKRPLAVLGILVAALTVAPHIQSGNSLERPPGVAADSWIALSDRLGFVIVRPEAPPTVAAPTALLLSPPVSGYFMMKGPSHWSRVVIVEPLRGPGDAG